MSFYAQPGVWIACAGMLFMFVNALRSWRAPVPFAAYFGLPLADERDAGLLRVYALRALFIGLTLLALLATRDIRALSAVAWASSVMPFGDAWLTARAGAPRSKVARHLAIAALLIVAGLLLGRGTP